MPCLLDVIYLVGLLCASPWITYKAITTGKYGRGLWSKLSGFVPMPIRKSLNSPLTTHHSPLTTWFHGVSVGEIHLLRQVVALYRQRHPDHSCVISTTTDTGYAEACKHFAGLPVLYWPFDFSWAVRRALRTVRPNLIVLAEGELWPNFLVAAEKQGVPVAVINGRMSPRSFRNYRRLGPLARWLFGRISLIAAQTEEYAANYRSLGAPRVEVTGNVKYDGVQSDRQNLKTRELRHLFGIRDDECVWIAGSTQAPEEAIALDIHGRIRPDHPNLRLIIVPRQKDRFEEVATLLRQSGLPFVRRSALNGTSHVPALPVILVDTIGELGAVWGLADIAFVGGSLDGNRGGQNMIEPGAYGAAVVFGPHVWNFKETATRLVEAGAAIQVADAALLEDVVRRLLSDEGERQRLGSAAREFVRRQQGATERTLTVLEHLLTVPLAKAG
jgi:3-deoxy-D-manno-octulosonic-acid transferase